MKILTLVLVCSLSLTACGQQTKNNQNTEKSKKENKIQDETILKPVKALIKAMKAENAKLIRAQFAKTANQAYGADGIMKTAEETKK